MSTIQGLSMTYDALNEHNTFSEGDTLSGEVTLALSKETTVESLFVKAKGDADVRWTTKSGDHSTTHHAHKRYFKLKQFLIPANSKDTVVARGIHVYKFSFTLPRVSMPSSFKGTYGKIVYKLEAKLSRSWRMDRTVERDIHFVSKSYPNLHSLMSQQVASTRKGMGLFSKGHVNMDVIVDKHAYAPGETIAIVAKINNSSSSEMTPKFRLLKNVVYRARGSIKHEDEVICKVVDHCIKSQTQKDIKCVIPIPRDQRPTIQNCDILSVEYHLKAYLDVSFAFDPEVVLPVIILPPSLALGLQSRVATSPYPPRDTRGPSNRDFPLPVPRSGSPGYPGAQRCSAPPPAYPDKPLVYPGPSGVYPGPSSMYPGPSGVYPGPSGVYPGPSGVYPGPSGVYPAQPSRSSEGCSNPVPQSASPYGSPFSSPSSSSVLHPPPTAPTFQTTPSAPEIHPFPCPPPFSISPTAPTYNPLPSAPAMMNTDFLSQSDAAPPAYSLLFPSSATDESDAK